MKKNKTVSVIGAGVAGLASAIRLQHAGYDVTLYEKEGILIIISNNQKKSLVKSQIILNIDFNKEVLNRYKINENAVTVSIRFADESYEWLENGTYRVGRGY